MIAGGSLPSSDALCGRVEVTTESRKPMEEKDSDDAAAVTWLSRYQTPEPVATAAKFSQPSPIGVMRTRRESPPEPF